LATTAANEVATSGTKPVAGLHRARSIWSDGMRTDRYPRRGRISMELMQLIAALSDPAAFPAPVGQIEVRQTHISVVLLAGQVVYKIKKPVRLDFLDFSTL